MTKYSIAIDIFVIRIRLKVRSAASLTIPQLEIEQVEALREA